MTEVTQKAAAMQKLLSIQAELPAVLAAKTKGHHGPYLSLPDLLTAVRPVLTQHGVVLTQTGDVDDGSTHVLTTKLIDAESGLTIMLSEWPLSDSSGKTADQDKGKSMTYARRYALMGLLGICGDDEEDADDKGKGKPRVKSKPAPAVQAAQPAPLANKQEIDKFIVEASAYAEQYGKEIVGKILAKHQVIKNTLPNWTAESLKEARLSLEALRKEAELNQPPNTP